MKQKADYHILTVTYNGIVSILKNLTADIARKTMQELLRHQSLRADPWNIAMHVSDAKDTADHNAKYSGRERNYGIMYTYGGFRTSTDSDFKIISLLEPDGVKLEIWPKPDDYDEQLAKALEQARIP
jgi:hypothetical protein